MSYVPPQGFPQQPYPPPYPPQYPAPTGYPPAPQGPQGGGADPRSCKRRFGMFSAMAMTAFSPDVWRDVAKNWTGIGVLYLLVLLVITWTAVLIRGYSSFSHFLTTESHEFVDQFPAVTVTNGVVSIDKPQPYVIRDPQTKKVFAVFDTTGSTVQPPADYPSFLVTRGAVIARKNANEVQTHDLSGVKSFYVDKNRIYGWLDSLKTWFIPIVLPLMVVFSLIGRLVLMLITAAIGMGFAAALGASIPFPAMLRLSVLAMTPTMLLSTVLTLIGVGDLWTIVGIVIVLTYLVLMVKANLDQFPVVPAGIAPRPPGYFPPTPPGYAPYPPAPGMVPPPPAPTQRPMY